VTQTLSDLAGRAASRASSPGAGDILEIRDLHTEFRVHGGVVHAVDGVNLTIPQGKTVGLVGESGSGKSITALSVMRLLESNGRISRGEILFRGQNLLKLSDEEMQDIRGNDISQIFQEPMTALNPVYSVGEQIAESVRLHQKLDRSAAWDRAVEMLRLVGISDPGRRAKEFPHELSGGMRQRVMIAMALSCNPDLLIADEPTTALDVTIQAQILELMRDLRERTGAAILLITHDLGVVAEMCDEVAVMYAGRIVEQASTEEIYGDPRHPYTQGLLSSIPKLGQRQDRLHVIRGNVPNPLAVPPGCAFHPRCPHRFEPCDKLIPRLAEVALEHTAACYLYPEVKGLPKVESEGAA
jgi:oligopeptide transport system ATP-binding protein